MGKTSKGAKEQPPTVDLNRVNFVRHAHNFLLKKKQGNYAVEEINTVNEYVHSILAEAQKEQKTYNVGLMFIAVNPPYWQYAKQVIEGAKQFFLPGHNTEIMLWTDMQNWPEAKDVNFGATVFPVDSMEWPYPTLMRYHFFLGQEEYLKKFDYLFYLDLDMRIVGIVGDEILGDGLTAAEHPMYALDKKFIPPYEPNPRSASYIPRPGQVIEEDGKARFKTLYLAGGFQGGTTDSFIPAMKGCRDLIDADLNQGYIPIWNDESAWNRYLFDHPPVIVLDPSYVYPDSMIQEYYLKIWGRNYTPRIITLTKPFSTSKEGGAAAQQMMNNLNGL